MRRASSFEESSGLTCAQKLAQNVSSSVRVQLLSAASADSADDDDDDDGDQLMIDWGPGRPPVILTGGRGDPQSS